MNQLAGWKNVALGIVGTVVLGAVGSGLWDLAGRPTTQWIGRGVLTAATLGSSAIKDATYREAAKGLHEANALQLLSETTLLFVAVFTGFLGYRTGIASSRKENERFNDQLRSLSETAKHDALKAEVVRLKNAIAKSEKQMHLIWGCTLFFIASLQFFNYLKLEQANEAYTYFSQSLVICSPYIDEHDRLILQSRFAAMKGRGDYIAITDELKRIAASNGRELPKFKPW